MVLIQSLIASCVTAVLTEICKISLLKSTGDPQKTIFYSSIFSYIIAYIAQRYVFNSAAHKQTNTGNGSNNSSNFFGVSLLKYIAVSAIAIQLYAILLKILLNISYIKKIIDNPNTTPSRKRIYQYLMINITILIVFLLLEFPMRKYFIFAKYKNTDYIFSYILYFIAVMIYLYTHTHTHTNKELLKHTAPIHAAPIHTAPIHTAPAPIHTAPIHTL